MTVYSVTTGGVVNALDVTQFFNLLTGVMTDQPITVSNRVRAALTGAAVGSCGYTGHTAAAAPTTGTFVTGDVVFDAVSSPWLCTAGGSPGTWFRMAPYRARSILGTTAASVVFSSIPTTLRTLRLTINARSDPAVVTQQIYMRVNADTAGNYFGFIQRVSNATYSASNYASQTVNVIGNVPGASAGANAWGHSVVQFSGWDTTSQFLNFTYQAVTYPSQGGSILETAGGIYGIGGPYTSLTVLIPGGNFIAGSKFLLEGWD